MMVENVTKMERKCEVCFSSGKIHGRVGKILLEISSSLIHRSLEANSCSENLKTVDCQKLKTVLRN